MADTPLYDPAILKDIPFEEATATFKPGISHENPGENLKMRPLNTGDYDRGFLQLLTQLTLVGDVSREEFLARFHSMKACKNTYYVTVIEDTELDQVVGAASLVVEEKFIHHIATRGRIEDVVVNDNYRGKQLGKLLVQTLTLLGKHVGCYKMTLECVHKLIDFYGQCGYKKDDGNNFMVQRFKK